MGAARMAAATPVRGRSAPAPMVMSWTRTRRRASVRSGSLHAAPHPQCPHGGSLHAAAPPPPVHLLDALNRQLPPVLPILLALLWAGGWAERGSC